ncbi:hypothetical protein CQW23_16464 [Capsicum baccatum]|uniref:Uncharacterized protein n=1 Tax=Capsicum baccatum TaxID=33114 RepID=A0A2G2WB88_CAPBA|nr:hypothetical protein CQW23_16464 [Capsicum baccatum]
MATCSVSLNQHGVLIPIQLKEFTLNSRISVPTRFSSNGFPSRITATSAVAVEQELRTPVQDATEDKLFACPICYEPVIRKGPSGFNVPAIYRSGFKCRKCNKSYSSKNLYLDLTVTSGTKEYNESKPTRTELFRSPVVSFLYERGWRQAFNQSGFPGADEELLHSKLLLLCTLHLERALGILWEKSQIHNPQCLPVLPDWGLLPQNDNGGQEPYTLRGRLVGKQVIPGLLISGLAIPGLVIPPSRRDEKNTPIPG